MTPEATLYWFAESNPSQAVRLMLEHKGIAYRSRLLVPGLHRVQVRLAGFRGPSVPALKIDGRRIQGSLNISRALEDLEPEPPLFPGFPERRAAVEAAERWGEQALQPISGRVFHWALAHDPELRRWLARLIGLPAPDGAARLIAPIARRFARDAPDDVIRADLAALPALLDHVDGLIATGTIGIEEPNAADFQIATSVRELLSFKTLRPMLEGRPSADLAMRMLPDWQESPVRLPSAWLPASQ